MERAGNVTFLQAVMINGIQALEVKPLVHIQTWSGQWYMSSGNANCMHRKHVLL
jgi:hypothetical protein